MINYDCFAQHILNCDGGGGGREAPYFYDNEPQKTGARSAQAHGVVKTHNS